MSIEIRDWKEINKGAVVASFTAYIPKWQLMIRDMTYFEKGDQSWVNFPNRKYEKDGETRYYAFVMFEEEARNRFNEACLKEIHKKREAVSVHSEQNLDEEIPF